MSVYIPNHKHDIFISYADADNQPFGQEPGWITTFIHNLTILLGKKLGRIDIFSLLMGTELIGYDEITPQVADQVSNSVTLVLILSPAYLASNWCLSELNTFLTKQKPSSGRIFIVEHDQAERPQELQDLLGYKFWATDDTGRPYILGIPKPNPEQFEYYQKLDDLARQLADKLKNLKSQPTTTTIPKTTVFLAEVTDDLIEQRTTIKRFLEQQNINVLPNKLHSFSNIQTSLDNDLKQTDLFVQLLSDKAGNGYPLFQYERGQLNDLPILQWRDPNLKDLTIIKDNNHRTLLETDTIIATGLIEFQTHILNQLKPSEILVKKDSDILVFVNAAPEDMSLTHKITNLLDENEIGYTLPINVSEITKSSEIRHYLEQNLLTCDVVILLYEQSSPIWVNEQLLYCQRIKRRREQPFKTIAVYKKSANPPLNVKLSNMQLLECATVDICLSRFLQVIQT
ncbi:toll/interleukin-1 receptor domain-containing protein [Candidatus Halobeggiatoa sp. HSG11]|nr:toll/interleukin-1 receptor domain-containing protein [Candidatus Halobeggiatoa sp. HSG11]